MTVADEIRSVSFTIQALNLGLYLGWITVNGQVYDLVGRIKGGG